MRLLPMDATGRSRGGVEPAQVGEFGQFIFFQLMPRWLWLILSDLLIVRMRISSPSV